MKTERPREVNPGGTSVAKKNILILKIKGLAKRDPENKGVSGHLRNGKRRGG
jgi:hypothetical protein